MVSFIFVLLDFYCLNLKTKQEKHVHPISQRRRGMHTPIYAVGAVWRQKLCGLFEQVTWANRTHPCLLLPRNSISLGLVDKKPMEIDALYNENKKYTKYRRIKWLYWSLFILQSELVQFPTRSPTQSSTFFSFSSLSRWWISVYASWTWKRVGGATKCSGQRRNRNPMKPHRSCLVLKVSFILAFVITLVLVTSWHLDLPQGLGLYDLSFKCTPFNGPVADIGSSAHLQQAKAPTEWWVQRRRLGSLPGLQKCWEGILKLVFLAYQQRGFLIVQSLIEMDSG